MDNGICGRQNEEKSIKMLAAQRKLYSEAGIISLLCFVLSVLLPALFAVLQWKGVLSDSFCLLTHVYSVIMIVVSMFMTKIIQLRKKLASSIQLKFDTYVYNMPWNIELFGPERELQEVIIGKSKETVENEKNKEKLNNWYNLQNRKEIPVEHAILSCQKENCRWDIGLKKWYKRSLIILVITMSVVVVVLGLMRNESFRDWMMRIVYAAPILQWFAVRYMAIDNDITRLEEMRDLLSLKKERKMIDLQILQKLITDHRKASVKVPNVIYWALKNNYEDKETRIAMEDANE